MGANRVHAVRGGERALDPDAGPAAAAPAVAAAALVSGRRRDAVHGEVA